MKTRFKSFLIEAREGVTYYFEEEIVDFIRKNCMQSLGAAPLWRGVKHSKVDNESFIIIDPSARGERKSLTGNNIMNTLLSNAPQWSKFPKRNISAFFTTNPTDAEKFGDVYRVFPVDGAVLGVNPASDFNFTPLWQDSSIGFNTASLQSNALGDCIVDVIRKYATDAPTENQILGANYDELMKWFDQVDANLATDAAPRPGDLNSPEHVFDRIVAGIKKKKSMRDTILNLINPDKAGFKTVHIQNFHHYDEAVEAWTTAKYAMVHKAFVDIILKEVRNT